MKRRQLLQLLTWGATTPLGLSMVNQARANSTLRSARKLVLVELAGANDGLNTSNQYLCGRPVVMETVMVNRDG